MDLQFQKATIHFSHNKGSTMVIYKRNFNHHSIVVYNNGVRMGKTRQPLTVRMSIPILSIHGKQLTKQYYETLHFNDPSTFNLPPSQKD